MDDVSKRGVRRANFSTEEIALITEFVKNKKEVLFGKLTPTCTKRKKDELWAELADAVSALGVSPRTVGEIKTKFKNLKMNAKQSFQIVKKARLMTGGGPAESLKEGEAQLCEIFKKTPAFNGLEGFVSNENSNYSDGCSSSETYGEEIIETENEIRPTRETGKKNARKSGKRKYDDVLNLEEEIQRKRLAILDIEYQVKEKELSIKTMELEKMKLELRTARIVASNVDAVLENN